MDRKAHDVGMRLKDSDKKFSGELGESWMEYVDEYQQISIDYQLSTQQKLQYLHNLLSKDAKRFYLERVSTYAQTFQQAVELVNEEYNSPVRQMRVKNHLNSLRISEFIKKGDEVSVALAKVYKLITKLSRQVPASHRGDAHKIEFLRNAAVGYSWSHEPLSRVATHGLSFQILYGELEAALQLDKEAKLAIARDSASSLSPRQEEVEIRYAGQGRYARNPKFVRERRTAQNSGKINPLTISGCFNCDSPDHLAKDCPKPMNAAKAAARRLEYYRKKDVKRHAVHHVLAEFCRQMDDTGSNDSDEIEGDNDVSIFLSALGIESPSDNGTMMNEKGEVSSGSEEREVFVMQCGWDSPCFQEFAGACVDSGAQKTVIGADQARSYCALVNGQMKRVDGLQKLIYTFGSHQHSGIGQVNILVPISHSFFLSFDADVVDANVPLLLGLDVLTSYRMILNFADDEVTSKADGWRLPLIRKGGHVYLDWTVGILYTVPELRKIHRHFYHPHSEKLYAMMRRADPKKVSPEVLADLERVSATCEVCQREADAPHRFRVSLPGSDCIFNRTVCMDLMSLDGNSVLHVVDKDTKFGAASFLSSESTSGVWETFMLIWVSPYVGFPDEVATDQGPQFVSAEWKSLLQRSGVRERPSGVESHNALGVGERYHSYLRRIYNKVRTRDPAMDPKYALQLAIKAVNDTAGPSGLVPTLLVFGVHPRIPLLAKELPDNAARMKALHEARKEMVTLSHQSKLRTASRSQVPVAADREYLMGEEVLMFREKPVGKWVGPYLICKKDGKMLTLDTGDRLIRASVDRVKPHLEHADYAPEDADEMYPNLDSLPAPFTGPEADPAGMNPEDFLLPDNEEYDVESDPLTAKSRQNEETTDELGITDIVEGIREAEEMRSSSAGPVNPSMSGEISYVGIHITEVLKSGDPRADSPVFRRAKKLEIDGLKNRKVWKVVHRSEVPADSNVLGGRFVLAVKNIGTKDEKAKARYIAQGHKDKDKPYMVHDTSTLRASSVRVILSVAAVKGFRIFSHDVNQAYVQSKDKLTRKIFVLPKKRDLEMLGVSEDELLELLMPLYGICDAGDYWGVTVEYHVEDDLNMKPSIGDPALYVMISDGEMDGIMGVYVDDSLNAGTPLFEKLTAESLKRFDSKPRVFDHFEFFGSTITTTAPGEFLLSQKRYAGRLSFVAKDCEYAAFRRYRAMLSWLSNTRPDLCCMINRAAQVTNDTMCREKLTEFNKATNLARDDRVGGLRYRKLGEPLTLKAYADAAFATNYDLSSHIGFIIILCDSSGRAHILDYSSKKSKRVVRSIMGAEVYAFADAFDRSFVIRKDLERLLGVKIQLHMFTDSKQLFDAMTKGQQTTEKRLMIDIAAAREAYRSFEIAQVGLVSTSHNPADGLSKVADNGALRTLLTEGIDRCPVDQWILREGPSVGKGKELGV